MEEFIKKLLFEDWSLSRLYETINSIKETETNKTIMFRIGKILGGKVDNCKWKTTSDEHIFVFSIIYNNETEKHKIKIYHGSPKIKFDNYVSGGRMKVGKEFPLPRKDISKKDIIILISKKIKFFYFFFFLKKKKKLKIEKRNERVTRDGRVCEEIIV